jgi:small subunit ribosomal protein S4
MMGPKEKKERALGERLQLKGDRCASPKCAMVRRPYRPGQHGKRRRRRMPSDFARQLSEKQKFKLTYGLNDRSLIAIFNEAQKKKGSTAKQMLELFERRLDNVIFRMGFAASRLMARQIVFHGHIQVNGKRVKSPGFQVKKGDVIRIRPESNEDASFKALKESLKEHEAPSWIHVDVSKMEGKIIAIPEDIESPFEVNLLVESFSK